MKENEYGTGDDGLRGRPSALLREIVQTREFRQGLGFLIPEIVDLWAGSSPLKRRLAAPVSAGICRSIQQSKNGSTFPSLQNPGDLKRICGQFPGLVSGLRSGLDALLSTVEKMAPQEQEELLKVLLAPSGNSDVGSGLASRGAKMMTDLHRRNPRLLTEALAPAVRKWFESTDFGELRDFLDGSTEDFAAFAAMLNDVLWQYPSKLVLLLSFLPDLFNSVVCLVKETIGRFNQVSPDIVTDIVLALFREIDARQVGMLANEALELFRKLHTGSALIGDPGLPRFSHDLKKALAAAGAELEPEAVSKALKALSEEREGVADNWTDFLDDNPEIWKRMLENVGSAKNARIRSLRKRLETLEAHPDDGLADAAAEGLSEIDTQEMAEILNLGALLANRLREAEPRLLKTLAEQMVNSLDFNEVGDAVEWAAGDLASSLMPAGRAILPHLLQAVCRIMEPADDEFEDNMKSAREKLRVVLLGEEATP